MKQAYEVNFEGFSFYMDEDARSVFFEFIEQGERKFKHSPDEKKEWEEFKKSLLEKFKKAITDPQKVMSLSELEKLINNSNMSGEFRKSYEKRQSYRYTAKDFYRDMDASVIAGVCSGLSRFLSTETTWIRVLFIILGIFTFPLGEIIYIIIWAVAPSNRQPEEKESAKQFSRKNHEYVRPNHIDNAFTTLFKGIGNLLHAILSSVAGIVGFALILVGIFIILGFFDLWPWHFFPLFEYHWWEYEWQEFIGNVNQDKLLLLISLALIIAIPALALIYNLIKTIFGIKSKNNMLKYLMLMLWFLCLVAAVGLWFSKDEHNGKTTSTREYSTLTKTTSAALYIEKRTNPHFYDYELDDDIWKSKYVFKNGEKYLYGEPEIEIIRSEDYEKFEITITKEVRMSSGKNFNYTIDNIEYNWVQNDSLLILDKYFYARDLKWWNSPKVIVEITVPKYTNVLFTGPFKN